MVNTRTPGDQSVVQFWLPDPNDLERVLHLLEICGYTDRCLAFEEANHTAESSSVIEVTITRRPLLNQHSWKDDTKRIEILHEGTWQA